MHSKKCKKLNWERSFIYIYVCEVRHSVLETERELRGRWWRAVGELVESAREQMSAAGETGPIQPTHLRRAHRRAKRAGTVPPNARHTPRLFWRSDTGA